MTSREYVIETTATGKEVDREIEATIEDKQEMGDLNHDRDDLNKNILGLYTRYDCGLPLHLYKPPHTVKVLVWESDRQGIR